MRRRVEDGLGKPLVKSAVGKVKPAGCCEVAQAMTNFRRQEIERYVGALVSVVGKNRTM